MVEKVSVNPGRVRCWGNIVSPKTLGDFYKYSSTVTVGSDTVDGDTRTVYSSGYLVGSYLTVSSDRLISPSSESFSVTATLKNSSNSAITGATLKCIVNDTVLGTGTTDSNGICTFTVPVVEESRYVIRVIYEGTQSISGCFNGTTVYTGTVTGVSVTCENQFMQTGDTNHIIATLTGTIGSEENVGIPYQTVSIYEEYEPTEVKIISNPNPVIKGDDTVITAVLRDSDGSGIKGETVSIYFKE